MFFIGSLKIFEYFNIKRYISLFFKDYAKKTLSKIWDYRYKLQIVDYIMKNKDIKYIINDRLRAEMSKEEAKTWMDTNKINCKIIEEYSNDITKGKFVSQSISANTVAHQGDKITIVYSLGKEPTTEEKNALKKAETYSNSLHMSKQGIYNQLTSSIEGFTKEAAQYAIDNIEADWNKNALEKAKTYQTSMNMSSKAIYNQLVSSVEGFTKSEAQYAIDNLDK